MAENPNQSAVLAGVVLTFNSELSIRRTLLALRTLTNVIYVVDSYSTDSTIDICNEYECIVVQHPFENYSAQRNWAINELGISEAWQLHLDADEELGPGAGPVITEALHAGGPQVGFLIARKIVFLRRVLRFGGMGRTWHCRLFRTGFGSCEDRLYDQHFLCNGPTRRLSTFILDHQEADLRSWTASHNRWSDMEALELMGVVDQSRKVVKGSIAGDAIQRRRYAKMLYYQAPLFLRAIMLFVIRYFLLLGFLDGARGFIFHFLQCLWFRTLVDAKIYEERLRVRDGQSVL